MLLAWASSLALVLPLALVVGEAIHDSLGHGFSAENLRVGFDSTWYTNFAAKTRGLAASFSPTIIGIGAILNGLDATIRGELLQMHPALVCAGLAYLALWVLLSAGLVPRYTATRSNATFASDVVRFFPRFALLTVIALGLYGALLLGLLSGLEHEIENITRETIDERIHFAWILAGHALVWALLWCISIVFDYAKILSVVADPCSPRRALLGAVRLVFGRPMATFGLSATLGLLGLVVLLVYAVVTPGASPSSWLTVVLAFVLGQVFLLARIAVRCLFWSSQTALAETLRSHTR